MKYFVKKLIAVIIIFMFIICFAGCAENGREDSTNQNGFIDGLKDAGNKILGDFGKNNPEAVLVSNVPPKDSNIHKINETFKFDDFGAVLEGTVTKVTVYNSIKESGAVITGDENNNLNGLTTEIELDSNGELFSECCFIICDVNVKNIKTLQNRDLFAEMYFYAENFDEEEFKKGIEGGTKPGEKFYYGLPGGEVDYFFLEQTETITRSDKSSEFYHFSLPENETAVLHLGYIIRKDIISQYKTYLSFGTGAENIQYVRLEYPKESVTYHD